MQPIDLAKVKSQTPSPIPEIKELSGVGVINLEKAKDDTPTAAPPVERLSGIKMAGLLLAVITLGIMLVFILFLVIFFFVTDLDASNDLRTQLKSTEVTEKVLLAISAEKKAYREFVMEMTKTVLINLLLPILTAILGYIFGSSKPEK